MTHTIIETCTGCTACKRKCPVDAIQGERNELHVIDARLCIDCGACGRICPSRAVLDEHARLVESIKPALWLRPVWIYPACVECRICVAACPTGAIGLLRDAARSDGLKPSHPWLQTPKTCIGCSFCAIDCPTDAIKMETPQAA